jgi:hypothetical protein
MSDVDTQAAAQVAKEEAAELRAERSGSRARASDVANDVAEAEAAESSAAVQQMRRTALRYKAQAKAAEAELEEVGYQGPFIYSNHALWLRGRDIVYLQKYCSSLKHALLTMACVAMCVVRYFFPLLSAVGGAAVQGEATRGAASPAADGNGLCHR